MCRAGPYAASGGKDTLVCLWSLADSMPGITAKVVGQGEVPTVAARHTFTGHEATVEDVVFHVRSGGRV